MVTGLDVVKKALWTIDTYHPTYNSRIGEKRCHPDQWPHVCDCSGFICFILAQLGIGVGCTNSAWFAQIGHQQGLGVSDAYARTHPGCLLIRGPQEGQQGYGNLGHIGVGMGNGNPFWMGNSAEARGTYAGVGLFEADDIAWSYRMKAPGVTYELVAPTPPPIVVKPPAPTEEEEMYWLPEQANDNFRPIGVQVVNHVIKVYNVSDDKNPFIEGKLVKTENAHKLIIPLAEGEEVLGLTRFNPKGDLCPPSAPIEVCTNLPSAPDNRGQPRHILHRKTA